MHRGSRIKSRQSKSTHPIRSLMLMKRNQVMYVSEFLRCLYGANKTEGGWREDSMGHFTAVRL